MAPSGPRLKKHLGGASLATHLARDIHVALTRRSAWLSVLL